MYDLLKQEETNIRTRYARPSVSNVVFYLPFAYYYQVRLGTVAKLLSWGLIYLMPTFWYSALAAGEISLAFCLNYALILLAAFTAYETGYILNDTFATKLETQPSIRLYPENFQYFYAHVIPIFMVRGIGMALPIAVLVFVNALAQPVIHTVLAILLIPFVFSIYNLWRNRFNVFFYPILVCSRYLPFMLPYQPDWHLYLLLFLAFPCCNMLERFSMPKYRYPLIRLLIPDEAAKTYFRVGYYLLLSLGLVFVFPLMECLPILILCAYRIIVAILVRFHTPRNYLQG